MEKIGQWCKLIALISVVSSVIFLILPEGSYKKVLKIMMSVIFVYAIASPFSEGLEEINANSFFSDDKYNQSAEMFEEYENFPLIISAEAETEKYLGGIIESMGIKARCSVTCTEEDGRLIIKDVEIIGPTDDIQKEKIINEIRSISDAETKIIFRGEENE